MSAEGNETGMNQTSGNKLAGRPFVATVVDNNDPNRRGRIRARIQELFEGIPDDHLPWARVTLQHPGGGSAQHGTFHVPEIGSKVLMAFQEGNPLNPEYLGYMIDDTTKLPEADVNYPHRHVVLYPSGSLIIIDKQSEDVYIRNSGDMQLYVTGDLNLKVDGNVTEHVKGNRTTFVDGNDTLVVGGNAQKFASAIVDKASGTLHSEAGSTHQIYAGGTSHRDAGGQIHDDGGGSASGASAPGAPQFPAWPGVRGPTP